MAKTASQLAPQQQVALITGASSGIGEAFAHYFAKLGYQLILVARREEKLAQLAQSLPVNCHIIGCDLANREQLNGLMVQANTWVTAQNLHLTVLVNNAGAGVWKPFEQLDTVKSQQEIDLNINAVTTLCNQFVAIAKAHAYPSYILNVASLAAILATPRYSVYSSTKAYVLRLSKILAYELKDTNISVTCTCPGGVLTEFMQHSGQTLKNNVGMMQPKKVAQLSVNAMFAGKTVFVPGLLNRLSTLANLLPRSLQMKVVANSMNITVKETQ